MSRRRKRSTAVVHTRPPAPGQCASCDGYGWMWLRRTTASYGKTASLRAVVPAVVRGHCLGCNGTGYAS
mgnify:CR=1 FL=1